MQTLNIKSNESLIYSLLGWSKCGDQIQLYEDCIKTGSMAQKNPTQCYSQAKKLQNCYIDKSMKIDPLCLPIFNDVRQCLFQGDSHILHCKQEINQLTYCQSNPQEYKEFLRLSTPSQKAPKVYNFVLNPAVHDLN